ncbi:MAG: alpha/beta hydrolase, partial [Ruminococcaceae bacterium]|nr:alpha/beta hydrolase [Oscillospiraceae bacterium]
HGMCSTWEMSFRPLIEIAKREYHIIAVAADGYDPENKTLHATTGSYEAEQVAEYLVENYGGRIDVLYGASMGGVYTLELLKDPRLSFGTIIVDGLSVTKTPQFLKGRLRKSAAKLESALIYNLMTKHQKLLVKALGLIGVDELRKMMYLDTSRTTLFNTVYDTLGYNFDYTRFEGANVHIWSGSEEKVCLKTAEEIKSVCPSVRVKVFDNCGHGSLLTQPERLLAEINTTSKEQAI